MRFAFIQAEKANWTVAALCRALKVTRSGFYAWQRRGPSQRRRDDERLRVHVRATFKRSRKTYGAPRIHDELKEAGETVSKKRVARLMKEEGIVARKKRKFDAVEKAEREMVRLVRTAALAQDAGLITIPDSEVTQRELNALLAPWA